MLAEVRKFKVKTELLVNIQFLYGNLFFCHSKPLF